MRHAPLFILSLVLPLPAIAQEVTGYAPDARVTAEFIRSAEEAAPASISSAATIARIEPGGKTTVVRQGTNRFTCSIVPDGSNAPFCADEAGWSFLLSAFAGQPRPSTTTPGIAYMAKGAVHYETPDGTIVMERSATTKEVKEPPHWMLLWPIDPETSGLPTRPNAGGTYIMFAGTPYAHLMIHQDPAMLVGQK